MKTILLVIALLVFSNCEIKLQEANAIDSNKITSNGYMQTKYIDGIEYHVYTNADNGIFVVNHTKERLEILLLKNQLR